MSEGARFAVFMTTWIALLISLRIIFRDSRDYKFKKRYYKYGFIAVGAVLIGFALSMKPPIGWAFFWSAAVVALSYLSYRCTRFCKACGKTVYVRPFYQSPPKFCTSCGAKLPAD